MDDKMFRLIILLATVYLMSTWTLDITMLVFPFSNGIIGKKKAALLLTESRQLRKINHF
ncbi:hypothetical protein ACDX78_05770 [Virgibacillus oceani]